MEEEVVEEMTHISFANPYEFDMAILQIVLPMIQRGIRIDEEKRQYFKEKYTALYKDFQTDLETVVGHDLNVNSTKAVPQYLFHELGLPIRKRGGKVSTKEEVLRDLLAYCEFHYRNAKSDKDLLLYKRGYLSIMFILKVRGIRKRLSSYINPAIDTDGRMRTNLSVGGTETGRFTSAKTLWDTGCNMQTIPKELRYMFIADEGKEIAEFDLERGESWIYAHLSNDPELIEIHQAGRDFHSETAAIVSSIFSDKPLSVSDIILLHKAKDREGSKLRFLGKKLNHASAYRMGPKVGADEVNKEADDTGITVTMSEFRKAQELWRRNYFMIESWWNEIEVQLNKNRTMTTPYGRKRVFHDRWGNKLFKDATAYVPQSTSVDYANLGMLSVYNTLVKKRAFALEILHQNHDSILVQYDAQYREEVIPTIIDLMESELIVGDHKFTIPVEAQYGHSCGPDDLITWNV